MSAMQPAPFSWGDISLSQAVFVDDVPHVTRRAVGEWLEYADPQNAIDLILSRKPHIEKYSIPVSLTAADGKNYDTNVYHPIGFHLLVMESGQPKAQRMKEAIAEFLWHFAGPRTLSFREELELMKLQRALANDVGQMRDRFALGVLVERLGRVCLRLGQQMPDLKHLGQDATQRVLPGM